MTVQDLIQICEDEERDPATLHIVIPIGGLYFDVETSDEQDRHNPGLVICTLHERVNV